MGRQQTCLSGWTGYVEELLLYQNQATENSRRSPREQRERLGQGIPHSARVGARKTDRSVEGWSPGACVRNSANVGGGGGRKLPLTDHCDVREKLGLF